MEYIKHMISASPIVLFMKGNAEQPMCGFSRAVVRILQSYSVPFETVDVLENPQLRHDLKDFSEWPTFPQLYVHGEFIGGCDIVSAQHENGQLQILLDRVH